MNLNQEHYKQNEKLSQSNHFTSGQIFNKFHNVIAKSITERGNSNDLYLADNSTPFNRAFFVRSIRTPKENALSVILSMVGRIGQRLIVGYFPGMVVFHPDTFYRQAWKLAVVPEIINLELLAMIYLFKAVSRRDLRNTTKPIHAFPCYTLRIKAESLEQAKSIVCPLFAVMGVVYA